MFGAVCRSQVRSSICFMGKEDWWSYGLADASSFYFTACCLTLPRRRREGVVKCDWTAAEVNSFILRRGSWDSGEKACGGTLGDLLCCKVLCVPLKYISPFPRLQNALSCSNCNHSLIMHSHSLLFHHQGFTKRLLLPNTACIYLGTDVK